MPYFTEIILSYFFIQTSILIFVVPFYFLYKHYHPGISFKYLVLNSHFENFLSSKQANYLIFAWAASEAIFWFVIPEFLLLLVIFLRIKNKRTLLIYDILGTAFGTVLGLIISIYSNFDVTKVPYVTQNMVHQVQAWYQGLGSFGLFFQPFSGVPYKVFVMNVHNFDINLIWFVFLAIAIRIARYYIFYLIFVGIHPFLHRIVSRNYIPIFLLTCFIFSTLFLKVYYSYSQNYVVDDKGVKGIKNIILLTKEKF
jgi:hypothetical protein